jgi:hypothetical protein
VYHSFIRIAGLFSADKFDFADTNAYPLDYRKSVNICETTHRHFKSGFTLCRVYKKKESTTTLCSVNIH